MSNIESDLLRAFMNLSVENNNTNETNLDNTNMNAQQLQEIIQSAVAGALAAQATLFDQKLSEATQKFVATNINAPPVEVYLPVTINSAIKCDEGLDVVKSLPEFLGDKKHYVSWRQAAHTAYELFAGYAGSSKHYQAVAIIRNKIKGMADGTLTSFSTPLNFNAIIARLDFCYADKRPIYLIEQKMSTLKQNKLSVAEYYDEVEKKLTLITNKTIMTYEKSIASVLNEKYRQDALRVFISGLKMSLSDTLFAARPADLPSALALAEELEGSRQRYNFAASFNKPTDNDQKKWESNKPTGFKPLNPNYKQPIPQQTSETPQPMDIDPSSSRRHNNSFRNNNNNGFVKRPFSGVERQSDRNRQKINNISGTLEDDKDLEAYHQVAEDALREDDTDTESPENIHFLGEGPCYPL